MGDERRNADREAHARMISRKSRGMAIVMRITRNVVWSLLLLLLRLRLLRVCVYMY